VLDSFDRRLGDGRVHTRNRDLSRALEAFQDAVQAAGSPEERSRALGGLGVVHDQLLDRKRAVEALEEALELARSSGSPELPARLHDLAVCRVGRGEADRAVPLLEEVWPLWSEVDDQARSVEALASVYLSLGRLREAESAYQQLSALGGEHQRGEWVLRGQNGRGEALRRAGREQEAMRVFQSVVEALGGVTQPNRGQQEQAGIALHNLGVLFLEVRPSAAQQCLEQAITCFVAAFGSAEHPHVARSKAFQGALARQQGQEATAQALFDEALRLVAADDPVATELVPALRG
jgi:tetratricopeptide (TPR) repeat protein